MQFDRKTASLAPALLVVSLMSAGPATAQPGQIEEIVVQGLQRMDVQAFQYLFEVEAGAGTPTRTWTPESRRFGSVRTRSSSWPPICGH